MSGPKDLVANEDLGCALMVVVFVIFLATFCVSVQLVEIRKAIEKLPQQSEKGLK